jgi:hypothetical protein
MIDLTPVGRPFVFVEATDAAAIEIAQLAGTRIVEDEHYK